MTTLVIINMRIFPFIFVQIGIQSSVIFFKLYLQHIEWSKSTNLGNDKTTNCRSINLAEPRIHQSSYILSLKPIYNPQPCGL